MAFANDTVQNSNVTPLTPSQTSEVRMRLRQDFQNYLDGFAGRTHEKRNQPQSLFNTVEQLRAESVYSFPVRP